MTTSIICTTTTIYTMLMITMMNFMTDKVLRCTY